MGEYADLIIIQPNHNTTQSRISIKSVFSMTRDNPCCLLLGPICQEQYVYIDSLQLEYEMYLNPHVYIYIYIYMLFYRKGGRTLPWRVYDCGYLWFDQCIGDTCDIVVTEAASPVTGHTRWQGHSVHLPPAGVVWYNNRREDRYPIDDHRTAVVMVTVIREVILYLPIHLPTCTCSSIQSKHQQFVTPKTIAITLN